MGAKCENVFITDLWFVHLNKETITIFTNLSEDLLTIFQLRNVLSDNKQKCLILNNFNYNF